jgi:histidyl-tRNA synthetase
VLGLWWNITPFWLLLRWCFLFFVKEKNMNNVLMNLKGTKDFINEEQTNREQMINYLKEIFKLYGFEPMETPILNNYDLLESKYAGGSEILKEVYKLTDQGKRSLGLRYDLTIPFVKVIGMGKNIRLPYKRYEIGKVFRDGPVKKGRMREFTQCDVDMVGISSIYAEIEFFKMTYDVFRKLEIDIVIKYNDRRILKRIIQASKIKESLLNNVIIILDKLEKIPLDKITEELINLEINMNSIDLLFNYIKMDFNTLESSIGTFDAFEQMREINNAISAMSMENVMLFTPTLARGLDIYTSSVWEVFSLNSEITSSIAAGGRYDNAVGGFLNDSKSYPAIGMSFGLDVINEVMNIKANNVSNIKLFIIPFDNRLEAIKLLSVVRNKGINSEMEMTNRKVSKSLEYANYKKIPFVVFLGDNEINQGNLRIKNMKTGEEMITIISELIELIK